MLNKIKKLLERLDELFTEYEFAKMQNDIIALDLITKERNSIYLNFNELLMDTL
jgi:hypothetical protein